MTHEQMMEKAWRFIHETGITEDQDDFEEMIRDWQADRAPEMDDLEIDEIVQEDGNWVAYAHDSKCTYSLKDDGKGNIQINYLGSR